MSIEERMTIDERRRYLHMMRKRYEQSDRSERGGLLDEMETITGSAWQDADPVDERAAGA